MHACALLFLPILAAALMAKLGAKPSRTRLLWTLAWMAGLFFAVTGTPGHLCDRGNPTMQWLIPGLASTATIGFLREPRAALLASLLLAATAVPLARQYDACVHSPAYVGNVARLQRLHRSQNERLALMKEELRASRDPTDHPAMWLRDIPGNPTAGWFDTPPEFIEAEDVWHSWLTGIRRAKRMPLDVWFPGGTRAAAADRVELRTR